MKKCISFIFIFITVFALTACNKTASDVDTGYLLDEDTGTIVGYDVSYGFDLKIPKEINDIKILHIGKSAFKDLGIKSVIEDFYHFSNF